jgi:3-hydroxyisobutyrate dehydrogenase-like beta-hydroxyacid dehydrogenase
MEVGFLGTGRMGKVMAANLLKAGHRVRAWDKSPEPLHELKRAGADIATTAADAFRGDAVISMLPNDQALREVFIEGDLLKHARASTVSVNMGTVSLDCVDALVAAHDARNIPYVAATVFGRPDVAAAAKLSIMAAGDSAAIDRVQPLFDAMGQKTYRVGSEPRHANIAKIAGNLMVACAIEATAEAATRCCANIECPRPTCSMSSSPRCLTCRSIKAMAARSAIDNMCRPGSISCWA